MGSRLPGESRHCLGNSSGFAASRLVARALLFAATMKLTPHATWILTLLLLAGCGDPSSTSPLHDDPAGGGQPTPEEPGPDAAAEALVAVFEADGGASALALFSYGEIWGGPVSSAGPCGHYVAPLWGGESAGTVSITGTSSPITLAPSSEAPHEYAETAPVPADIFTEGEAIEFSATGATVPPFSGTVSAPEQLTGVGFPSITFSRSNPPPIVWDAGAATEIWVWLSVMTLPSHYERLWCRADDAGHFTIPREAMALLPEDLPMGSLTLWRVESDHVEAGDWRVELVAADRTESEGLAFVP
jgi:hypothetical protein